MIMRSYKKGDKVRIKGNPFHYKYYGEHDREWKTLWSNDLKNIIGKELTINRKWRSGVFNGYIFETNEYPNVLLPVEDIVYNYSIYPEIVEDIMI